MSGLPVVIRAGACSGKQEQGWLSIEQQIRERACATLETGRGLGSPVEDGIAGQDASIVIRAGTHS